MNLNYPFHALIFVVGLTLCTPLLAQVSTSEVPASEINEIILAELNPSPKLTSESTSLLGDQLDLQTGNLGFEHVDVSIPGNFAIPVEIRRVYRNRSENWQLDYEFGSWSLEVPRIETTVVSSGGSTSGSWAKGNACSGGLRPDDFVAFQSFVKAQRFWHGDTLVIPGKVNSKLLSNYGNQFDKTTYPKVTNSFWRVSCFTRLDGESEGFKVQGPDGLTYYMDVSDYISLEPLEVGEVGKSISRRKLLMKASRVEDRFGNWVEYHYENGKLTSIESSESQKRLIHIDYTEKNGKRVVSSITANNRTWEYHYRDAYDGNDLSAVVLPSGARWEFNFTELLNPQIVGEFVHRCRWGSTDLAPKVGTLKHPFGAVGEFTVTPIMHGISYVEPTFTGGTTDTLCYANYGLIRKGLTVPSSQSNSTEQIDYYEWNYRYSENKGFLSTDPTPPAEASISIELPAQLDAFDLEFTEVTVPDGNKKRYINFRGYDSFKQGKLALIQWIDSGTDAVTAELEKTYLKGEEIGSTESMIKLDLSDRVNTLVSSEKNRRWVLPRYHGRFKTALNS